MLEAMAITRVADLMTSDVFTLGEEEDFLSANQIMQLRHVRHLPVTRGKRLVGLVTHRDLMRAQARLLTALAGAEPEEERAVTVGVSEIMSEALLTCSADTPADDAARMMLDAKIGCMLVTEGDDDVLVGILTETDIMMWAVETWAKQRFESVPPPPKA